MKLATRISLFFLVSIAIVLASFSGSIYWIVRAHLYRQLNDRLLATLDTLSASIETGPKGLEWEPNGRSLDLGEAALNKSLLWGIFDNAGHRVDGATEAASMLLGAGDASGQGLKVGEDVTWNSEVWRVSRRDIRASIPANELPRGNDSATKRYVQLFVTAATSLTPVAEQLRVLIATLAGISILAWLIAALLGGWLCRNALAPPLTQMSDSISAISPADLSQRLVPLSTNDQLGELCRAFNQMLDRLQTSFERQRRFAGDASHQLRTPLTSMLGQVDVALRRDRSTEEYRRTLVCVREQSVRLSRIIEMLLFLAREGADVIWSDCVCFELNDWLVNYLQQWRQHPRFNDIRLDIDGGAELLIRAHDGLLGQAIDNLIDNACKYSEPNSIVAIRTARSGEFVTLEIEDGGCGISEAELVRVRDPFFRSDEVRRRGIGGAGLGLSVAQQIVNAFGSRLSIESAPGRGSIVTITFTAQDHNAPIANSHTNDAVKIAN